MTTSSNELSIFIFGVTGYLGGAIAYKLNQVYPDASYTAYVRSPEKAAIARQYGYEPLVSTGDKAKDLAAIKETSKNVDIVVNTADADDLDLTKAILEGLGESSKKVPLLFHISGTGVVTDGDASEPTESSKKIYNDSNVDDIKSIPAEKPHRRIDLEILKAGESGKILAYIIAPATVYGVAHENHGNKLSIQVIALIKEDIKRKQSIYAGKGTNFWSGIHIYDQVDEFIFLLKKALRERADGAFAKDPYERFYWGAVREFTWGAVARALGPILFEKKLADSPDAVSVSLEDARTTWTTTNAPVIGKRAVNQGWKPTRGSIFEYLAEDVEFTAKSLGL